MLFIAILDIISTIFPIDVYVNMYGFTFIYLAQVYLAVAGGMMLFATAVLVFIWVASAMG